MRMTEYGFVAGQDFDQKNLIGQDMCFRAWVASFGSTEIGGAKQRKPRVCLCPDVVNLRKR